MGSESKTARQWNRGYLPHHDIQDSCQFVTFRLADSLPKHVVSSWQSELRTASDSFAAHELSQRIEDYLDRGIGACHLRREPAAQAIEDAMLHFDATRYRLGAWCVMPNHVHAVLMMSAGSSLDKIVHSWKSFSAKKINRVVGRTGRLWQREYFDRLIRDEEHFRSTVRYVEANPVLAGLVDAPEDWPWSSARRGSSASLWRTIRE